MRTAGGTRTPEQTISIDVVDANAAVNAARVVIATTAPALGGDYDITLYDADGVAVSEWSALLASETGQ